MTWNASRKRLAARYLAACALYVTIGALSPSFMLSWPVAAAYFSRRSGCSRWRYDGRDGNELGGARPRAVRPPEALRPPHRVRSTPDRVVCPDLMTKWFVYGITVFGVKLKATIPHSSIVPGRASGSPTRSSSAC